MPFWQGKFMNMKSRKKLVQTGLEIDVKPISDKGLTEEEYMAKVAELKKEAEIKKQQETLNKVAEQYFAARRPRGPIQRQQRRPVQRRNPHPQYGYIPNSGLLATESPPRTSPFMGLLAIPETGSKK